MGVVRLPTPAGAVARRLDILYAPPQTYPFTLLHFTGNAMFNIDLRNHAINQGYSLNELGLTYIDAKQKHMNLPVTKEDVKNKIKKDVFETEADILNFLGVKYVPATQRKANTVAKILMK